MENQIDISDQNNQQIGQYPVNQQNVIPQEKPKPKIHYLIILLIVVLLILLLGFTGVYLFALSANKQIKSFPNPTAPPTTVPTSAPSIPISSITPSISNSNESQAPPNETLVQAHNELGLKLLKDINLYPSPENKEKGGNIFISPISISLALSMAYHGARGNTQQEMGRVLNYSSFSTSLINGDSQKLLNILNQSKDVTLEVANSIWINEHTEDLQVKINPQFVTDNTNYYLADTKTLDFWQPNADKIINSWVNEKTHAKIPDIVPSPIDKEVVMYIINAIYFKGYWAKEIQFDKSLTQIRQFYPDNKPIASIQMMKQENEFLYQDNDQFQAVELPYGKKYGNFHMYVFLPKKNYLTRFFESLTMENLNTWRNEFSYRDGTLLLPRFKLELKYDLKDTLERLGMKEAFTDNANFIEGITLAGSKPVKISKVLHKTFIDVNEEGSEAAAATAIELPVAGGGGEPPKPFYMEVNRPFVFMIEDGNTNEILFLGLVKYLSN